MNYNNGFPMGYTYFQSVPPVVQQAPQQQPQIQVQQNNNTFAWVMGEEAAKSYLMGPNQTVFLMDSENPYFYIKKSDHNGMATSFQIFEYKEVMPTTNTQRFESVNMSKIEQQLEAMNNKVLELEQKFTDIPKLPDKGGEKS